MKNIKKFLLILLFGIVLFNTTINEQVRDFA